MCRNTANNINFHYRTNSVEINGLNFSLNSRNTIFGPFPQFLEQKVFLKTPAVSGTTSKEFLAPCKNSEKSNDPIPRKHPDRQQDGRIDRSYFIGSFQLPMGV